MKYEPTVDEILYGTLQGDDEYREVLKFIYRTCLEKRIEPTLALDRELFEHLEHLSAQTIKHSKAMRDNYKKLYANLAHLHNQYTIW
jgi:hypothetical protein